jgi:hypothetical protein
MASNTWRYINPFPQYIEDESERTIKYRWIPQSSAVLLVLFAIALLIWQIIINYTSTLNLITLVPAEDNLYVGKLKTICNDTLG